MNAPGPVKTSQRRAATALRPALKTLARQSVAANADAAPDFDPDESLPEDVRIPLEQALGQDFSGVRVHTGSASAALAGALGANAVADGDDVVFADGRFQPGTAGGRELLAHELSHVAQQRQGGGAAAPAEARARSAAATVARGGSVAPQALGGADPGLHCDPDDKKKKSHETPPRGGILPPMPDLRLKTLPPLDYLKLQGISGAHGQRLSLRDTSDMASEWTRGAEMLKLLHLDQGIHLGPFSWTRDELLDIGIGRQFQDRMSRENPNSYDRLDQQWNQTHQGGFTLPPSILSHTWTF